MEQMKIYPLHLTVLMNLHANVPIQAKEVGPPYEEAIKDLQEDLIIRLDEKNDQWVLTDKGRAWIRLILSTPQPLQIYVDPRTNEPI